jgi:hypothetical protein
MCDQDSTAQRPGQALEVADIFVPMATCIAPRML